ncbi:hypothetical protein CSG_5740 [Campylobacter fetus subsp. venerealis str. 84-112]|nr:hypothetical protein CSG_5740 [Campylobacter fetus subsp. venerealis str. 84-112]
MASLHKKLANTREVATNENATKAQKPKLKDKPKKGKKC